MTGCGGWSIEEKNGAVEKKRCGRPRPFFEILQAVNLVG
jgi:hypothetical protein